MDPLEVVSAKCMKRITEAADRRKNDEIKSAMACIMYGAYLGQSTARVTLNDVAMHKVRLAGYSICDPDERRQIYTVSWKNS